MIRYCLHNHVQRMRLSHCLNRLFLEGRLLMLYSLNYGQYLFKLDFPTMPNEHNMLNSLLQAHET